MSGPNGDPTISMDDPGIEDEDDFSEEGRNTARRALFYCVLCGLTTANALAAESKGGLLSLCFELVKWIVILILPILSRHTISIWIIVYLLLVT